MGLIERASGQFSPMREPGKIVRTLFLEPPAGVSVKDGF
jgi:hypothetical protein